MELLTNVVAHGCAFFTTFHVVISEKESVELFYKVRNGWNLSCLALGCSLAKLFKNQVKT